MIGIYAPHKPKLDHLNKVLAEMAKLGPPTIHVYFDSGKVYAIEGSHRLCAAYLLDLPVDLVFVDANYQIKPNRSTRMVLDSWGWGSFGAYYLTKVRQTKYIAEAGTP